MAFDTTQDAYQDFRDIVAERTNQVVAWVGSGLSLPAGIPLWKDLHAKLCDTLQAKAEAANGEERNLLLNRLESARNEMNYWVAFKILRDTIGSTSYREIIKTQLRPADTCVVPYNYLALWRIGVSGYLNLNLDRLATRAHGEVFSGKRVFEFFARDASESLHLLKSPHPFVANLHGISENVGSWVFTHDDLQTLFANSGYIRFVDTVLASRTVLFVGLSADDVAAGGHLERLSRESLDLGAHFWITHRADAKTSEWAERVGIRVIRYSSANDHAELKECFDDLISYLPEEKPILPISPTIQAGPSVSLPDPAELERQEAEAIRSVLNAHALTILSTNDPKKYVKYDEFCSRYEEAIHRAWFVGTVSPKNRLFGYEIKERIERGAFGTVYRALGEGGENVAIKILHAEIRDEDEMLQSFRRGVSSMEILSRHKVPGVVVYRQASEIPASVVMEFVEGPSLQEAVDKYRLVREWSVVLKIAVELTSVIRSSHQLPERVLHRDIRPSNIMLRHGWNNDPADWEVVVLDFDLSWHREAREISVTHRGAANGYLAPEQVNRSTGASTRNALVDSYGLGMTLYFLRTAQSPQVLQPQFVDWKDTLQECAERNSCVWSSLPLRYVRLIYNATMIDQSERWDVTQIYGELERLQQALLAPHTVESAELIAEELGSRAFQRRYEWNPDALTATFSVPTGVSVILGGDEVKRVITIEAVWSHKNDAHYASVSKWLPKAYEQAHSALRRGGWQVSGGTTGGYQAGIAASISTTIAKRDLNEQSKILQQVIDALTFQ